MRNKGSDPKRRQRRVVHHLPEAGKNSERAVCEGVRDASKACSQRSLSYMRIIFGLKVQRLNRRTNNLLQRHASAIARGETEKAERLWKAIKANLQPAKIPETVSLFP